MKKLWQNFKQGLFTKSQFVTGVTLTMLATSAVIYAFNQLSLNIFTSGSTISASEVNANFEYLKERIDYLSGGLVDIYGQTSGPIPSTGNITSNFHTLGFNSIAAEFDTTHNVASQMITNSGFSVTENATFEFTFKGAMDTSVNTNAFTILPIRRYIDSTGSTAYSNFISITMYSWSSGGTVFSWQDTLQSGDFYYLGIQNYNPNNVDLLPGYQLIIRKK